MKNKEKQSVNQMSVAEKMRLGIPVTPEDWERDCKEYRRKFFEEWRPKNTLWFIEQLKGCAETCADDAEKIIRWKFFEAYQTDIRIAQERIAEAQASDDERRLRDAQQELVDAERGLAEQKAKHAHLLQCRDNFLARAAEYETRQRVLPDVACETAHPRFAALCGWTGIDSETGALKSSSKKNSRTNSVQKGFFKMNLSVNIISKDIQSVKKLSRSARDELKAEINSADPADIFTSAGVSSNPDKRFVICPQCGNGTGESHTPVEANRQGGVWLYHCQKCGDFSGDLLKIISREENLNLNIFNDFCQALAVGAKLINYPLDNAQRRKAAAKTKSDPTNKTSPAKKSELAIINEQLAADETALKNFVEQCGGTWRGLPFSILEKHNCRFIQDWLSPSLLAKKPDAKNWAATSPRVLIPADTDPKRANYLARLTVPAETFKPELRKYIHEKEHAGRKTLFNINLLTTADLVIAVEGAVDAMSLELAGFNAVAFGGADSYELLVSAVDALKDKPDILILLDSDKAGREHAQKLQLALSKINCRHATKFLSDDDTKIDANQILIEQGLDALRERIRNIIADARKSFAAKAEKATHREDSTAEIIADIRERCAWKTNSKGNRTVINNTFANIKLIFENDPNLVGLVGYDEFRGENIFLKQAAWHETNCTGEQWTDDDDAQLRNYLRENYAELKEKQLIEDAVIYFSRKNSFNAVKRFLESLPQWDGQERMKKLFVKFLHAEDTEYTQEITENWLLGAIARVFNPGCDYQTCLVLQGAQRIGKSRIISMLGGKYGVNQSGQNWHVALKDSVDDSHAVDALQKGWIIEIEEFSAGRKAEINALKSFISAADDTRRFSYDRKASTRKRHVVFAVTCNDEQFLRDPTGNARFLILKCSQKKFDRVEGMTPDYIRQVLAEALHKYNEMFQDGFDESKLQLKLETQIKAEEKAEAYLQDDGLTGEIIAFLEKPILPQPIWLLMTKDERRKFFVEGHLSMVDALREFNSRARTRGGGDRKKIQRHVNFISAFFDGTDFELKGIPSKDKNEFFCIHKREIKQGTEFVTEYTAYGTEQRHHICAAEIFNEAISNGDKRKAMYRINEILSQLSGWHLGERKEIRNVDPEYREQKKPYFRGDDSKALEKEEKAAEPLPFDTDNLPFGD